VPVSQVGHGLSDIIQGFEDFLWGKISDVLSPGVYRLKERLCNIGWWIALGEKSIDNVSRHGQLRVVGGLVGCFSFGYFRVLFVVLKCRGRR